MEVKGTFCLHEAVPLFEPMPTYKEKNRKTPTFHRKVGVFNGGDMRVREIILRSSKRLKERY